MLYKDQLEHSVNSDLGCENLTDSPAIDPCFYPCFDPCFDPCSKPSLDLRVSDARN